jgi:ferredoxin--NADP+ reductase
VQAAREYILSGLPKAMEPVSATRLRFDFLASPTRIIGNELGQVIGLEVENTKLVPKGNDTKAVGLGVRRVLDVDTVVFCIGDKVDESFGLPVQWNEFVKSPNPCYPIDGVSFEAYNPQENRPLEGIFVAGWSREASSGLVGVARKDGENGARAMLQYLKTLPANVDETKVIERLEEKLAQSGKRLIWKEDVARLEAAEQAKAQELSLEEYKLDTNEDMLTVIG